MADVQIKRRRTGAPGSPDVMKNGELAFNEVTRILYYGLGADANGNATEHVTIAGPNIFVRTTSDQNIEGTKTFISSPIIPVPTAGNAAANKGYVDDLIATRLSTSHEGQGGSVHAAVTTSAAGFMTAADKVKLDGIAAGATSYTHPSGDGNLHVPATGTGNNGRVLRAGATAGSMSWSDFNKTDVGLGNVDNTADADKPISTATQTALDAKANSSHVHAISGVTGLQTALDSKANLVHTHAFTDIPGLQTAIDGKANVVHSHSTATTLVDGFLSAADKAKLDSVAANANAYTHPSGDGNLHVPATGTTNDGRFLRAGSTAGSLSWSNLTKSEIGLGNVDNTADINKPISTATQTALDAKANLASPSLTGTPTAPTAAAGTNTTQLSTTAFVAAATAAVVGGAPTALNTLAKIAAAINNDAAFATTINTAISGKQNTSAILTAVAGVAAQADRGVYFTSNTAASTFTLTSQGRALLDDADPAANRVTMGLGSISTQESSNVSISGGTIGGVAIVDGGTF